jgi:hypothetical protein
MNRRQQETIKNTDLIQRDIKAETGVWHAPGKAGSERAARKKSVDSHHNFGACAEIVVSLKKRWGLGSLSSDLSLTV